MPGFPGTADGLQLVFMDADGPHSLTAIAIPSGQSIPLLTAGQPSTWQNIAKGGYPILPPGALVLGTPSGYSGFGAMTPNQAYQYSLTNVTDYGETLESAILTVTAVQMGTNTSVRLNLPPDAQSTTDVKVRARRLYRSTAGGSTRGFVAQINDMALTHYIDSLSDTGLGDAPPSSDTSGAVGAVSVVSTDSAYASWTEKQYGSALAGGQFSVDYGFDANGGTVHFAAVDVGKHITLTFTASIALTSSFFNSQIQAIKDIRTVLGSTPQGTAADLTTRIAGYDTLPGDVSALYSTYPNANAAHATAVVGSFATGLSIGRRPVLYQHYLIVPVNTGFFVVDIGDPTHPVSDSFTSISGQCTAAAAMGQYVFIASGSTIYCYSLSFPQLPVAKTNINAGDTVLDLAVQGRYLVALLGGSTNKIKVWDMNGNPGAGGVLYATGADTYTNPVLMAQFKDAFVNVIDSTTHLWGVTIPAGTAIGNATDSHISGANAICHVADVIAVGNAGTNSVSFYKDRPGAQNFVSSVALPNSPTAMTAAGRYLFVACPSQLCIVDMSVPSAPVLLTGSGTGIALTGGTYTSAIIYGGHIILGDTNNGMLYVLDLTSISLMAARIALLFAGRIYSSEGLWTPAGVRAARLDVGRGGFFADGSGGVGGDMSIGGHVSHNGALLSASSTLGGTATGTVAPGANAGTGATVTINAPLATDRRGNISVLTGTSPSAGLILNVTFAQPYETIPAVVISPVAGPGVSSAAPLSPEVYGVTTAGFSVRVENAPSATAVYAFTYVAEN